MKRALFVVLSQCIANCKFSDSALDPSPLTSDLWGEGMNLHASPLSVSMLHHVWEVHTLPWRCCAHTWSSCHKCAHFSRLLYVYIHTHTHTRVGETSESGGALLYSTCIWCELFLQCSLFLSFFSFSLSPSFPPCCGAQSF